MTGKSRWASEWMALWVAGVVAVYFVLTFCPLVLSRWFKFLKGMGVAP